MAKKQVFHYCPKCSAPGCKEPAIYKVGAVWSDGSSNELKNYGLACEVHRSAQVQRAVEHHNGLKLADGERVGPVSLYVLAPGRRDTQLAQAAISSL
jgi:hypothetical protein